MTTLTKTINDMAAALGMNAIELFKAIEMNNILEDDEQIETEDQFRNFLVNIAFNSRMCGGQEKYSEVCRINDAYFKAKLAA